MDPAHSRVKAKRKRLPPEIWPVPGRQEGNIRRHIMSSPALPISLARHGKPQHKKAGFRSRNLRLIVAHHKINNLVRETLIGEMQVVRIRFAARCGVAFFKGMVPFFFTHYGKSRRDIDGISREEPMTRLT